MDNKDTPVAPYVTQLYDSYFSSFYSVVQTSKTYGMLSTFFFAKKIFRYVVDILSAKDSVFQAGVVGGNFERAVFEKIGENADYTIADISQIRLNLCADFLGFHENLHLEKKDVRFPFTKKYDTVLCAFLLHEMPDKSKKIVIENILESLNEKGKAVFIDYHVPAFHLIHRPVRWFNRLFEPFADSLFDRPFEYFLPDASLYTCKKQLFCLGLYQCVVVKRKKTRSR